MFREYDFKRYDVFVIILVIALVALGVVAIKSATTSAIDETDLFYKKQIVGFIVGFILMIIISLIDYKFIAKFYWLIYFLNIALLLAVLVFGKPVNGATRWINIGGIGFQSSEFCKVFLIIFLAKFLDKNKERVNKLWFLLLTVILVFIPVYLILKEPNLSTSLVIFAIMGTIIFVSGLNLKFLVAAVIIFVPLFILGFWYIQQPGQVLLKDYQVTRVLTLINREEATTSEQFQTQNSKQAIGSGQLHGKGLYQGKLNQYNYLPEPQTDFIFSIIGEEFGFVGCSLILVLLLILVLRCLWIAKDAKDLIATIIIVGFVSLIAFQTFVNVGVTTDLLPNTGIPLPFISYGLSSLWTNMIAVGLILNISMQRKSIYY